MTLDLATAAVRRRPPPVPLSAAILCAGVTSVDLCRAEPERTARINVHGMIALARALADQGVFVVFPSSNMVFDGARPHRREEEPTCPRTEYGRQKVRVEEALATLAPSTAVVRFTKILGSEMPLIRGWIDALRAGREIYPFFDMVMAPVTHAFATEALAKIVEERQSGVFHVSARQDVSYAEVARRLARRLEVSPRLVVPVSSQTRGLTAEVVPAHTTLDATRLRTVLGMESPDAWDVIDATFDRICEAIQTGRRPEIDALRHAR
jgi:dTDP-4-dehydrorhamnose reductase